MKYIYLCKSNVKGFDLVYDYGLGYSVLVDSNILKITEDCGHDIF